MKRFKVVVHETIANNCQTVEDAEFFVSFNGITEDENQYYTIEEYEVLDDEEEV